MKRIIVFILLIAMTVCICGCGNRGSEMIKPVNVYYCRETVDHSSDLGIFAPIQLDIGEWDGRMLAFINFYISAPVRDGLRSPFPTGAGITSIEYLDNALRVQLNPLFARLSTGELTVACACISLTLFELTNANSVRFNHHGATNDTVAVMTRDNLLFKDEIAVN